MVKTRVRIEPQGLETTVEPIISVLILNLNGREYLGPCLDSIMRQHYPQDRIEIIVLDNGSTDGSAGFVREHYPTVRLIEADHNLGFAGGNNAAAGDATGEYLALINNDAVADPEWLAKLVGALRGRPAAACAGGKLLNADGTAIDFVRSALTPSGRAFQVDEGLPAGQSPYEDTGELFAPCGGAMLIDRKVFLDVGGFDEDFFAYYEDVDLGWRLWLYGYEVIIVPDAVVYHRQHRTGRRVAVEQRVLLAERNALRTIIKNYDEENLWRMLPTHLLMGVKRALDLGQLDRRAYEFGAPSEGETVDASLPREAVAGLMALDSVAEEMPRLLSRRREIQARRVRSDAEIFSRFPLWPHNPVYPWRHYNLVQDQLVKAFEPVPAVRSIAGGRLLMITHEKLGPLMAGPAIRAWELARVLSADYDVTIASAGRPERDEPGLRSAGFDPADPYLEDLAPHLAAADIVMTMGPLLARYPPLRDLGKPTIVDLYDPYELEKLSQATHLSEEMRERVDRENSTDLRLQSLLGDFFICASERQRDLWLGVLLAAGRINTETYRADPTLRSLIDVVPFGVPERAPLHTRQVLKGIVPGIDKDDLVLFWNGGLWEWFDPLTLIEALALVTAERNNVKLFFAAARHFDSGTVPEMAVAGRVRARAGELGLLDRHVFFGDWVPYDERGDYLLEADLGVSVHHAGLESRFASRTRLLDCFWAGLPVVVTGGDPLAEMVQAEGLGFTVAPGDARGLAEAILAALADTGLRSRVAQKAAGVSARLAWPRVAEPLQRFMERAAFAPDALLASREAIAVRQIRGQADMVAGLQALVHNLEQGNAALEQNIAALSASEAKLREEHAALTDHLHAIQQGRVMRALAAVRHLSGRE